MLEGLVKNVKGPSSVGTRLWLQPDTPIMTSSPTAERKRGKPEHGADTHADKKKKSRLTLCKC